MSGRGREGRPDTLMTRWPPPRHQSRRRSALRRSVTSSSCSRTTFDPAALSRRVAELEGQMGEPGFWDDQAAAAKVSAEHARTTKKVESFAALQSDVDDLDGLVELAEEDPEVAAEVDEQFDSVEARLGALEEERLFSGPYDAGDALVTVNARAGGAAPQGWGGVGLGGGRG